MKNTEPWTSAAVCVSIGGDAFYPEAGESWKTPIGVCRTCPVRLQCLDYAMREEQGRPVLHRFGVFGGLKPYARKKYEAEWLAGQVAA
jgi:WhiB family redox-sensing transcriptional regulator